MARTLEVNGVDVAVGETSREAGRLAATRAREVLGGVFARDGAATAIFASAPSQDGMLEGLRAADLPWSRLESFHMDEYVGLPASDPRSFSGWLSARLPEQAVHGFHAIDGMASAAEEIPRYGALIAQADVDLTCMGIGVNGHVAFNEPGQTDLDDPRPIREIALESASRQQQVDEDCFDALEEVPTSAYTLTVPSLLSARRIVVTVLGAAKAEAVARALTGPVSGDCPASALRLHPSVQVFLDEAAASRLA